GVGGAGGSGGDSVRRVLARATGTRLVLNERVLAALEERYRRVDRPLPRRAERLALLPQGATVWVGADGESGWALVTGSRAFAVLAREGGVGGLLAQPRSPLARARASARGGLSRGGGRRGEGARSGARGDPPASVSRRPRTGRPPAWAGRAGGPSGPSPPTARCG